MSASLSEVQAVADQLLELLGVRIPCGQMVIHFNDFHVQRVETNTIHKPQAQRPMRKNGTALDIPQP